MAYTIYEKLYGSVEDINKNGELTVSCKVLVGNKIYNWSSLGLYSEVGSISDTVLNGIDAKGRYCGVFENMEAYETSDIVKINSYIIIDNIVHIINVKDQIALKTGACNILQEGDTINTGINLAKQENGAAFFLLKDTLYNFNTVTSELLEYKLFKEGEVYTNQKRYVLDEESWKYIVHYLTRYSADVNDLKAYRDESTIIDNSSLSAEKSFDSSFIASYLQGIATEDVVTHNTQEIQRLLHIRADKPPLTAKNGGLIVNEPHILQNPESKVFSSQILNQKFNELVPVEDDNWLNYGDSNEFLEVLNTIKNKTGDYEDLRQINKDTDTTVVKMINDRFYELGMLRKLSTPSKDSSVNALNDLNRFVLKTGTILWYAGIEIPDGWKLCDGSIVNISDYPELYSIIGDTYNLPSDTFDTTASFRLPSGTARVIVGYDEDNEKFNPVGYRDGMNDVPVDIDFTQSQHKITDIKLLKGTEEATCIEQDLDKDYEYEKTHMPAWYPEALSTDGNGYDCWRQYSSSSNVKEIEEDVDWYRFSEGTAYTSTAGSSNYKQTHYNIQPFLTLKMIIKLDKELL